MPIPTFREGSKRLFDVLVALIMLVVVAPLMLVIATSIKLESRGPVLYRSRRVGLHGGEFDMLKFRKMGRDAAGPALTASRDPRFTRVGKALTASRLDELPQLFNVVVGQMSLIGPRPEDPSFVRLYPEQFDAIHVVRPGITGLSQLAFANERQRLDVPDPVKTYAETLLPAKLAIERLYLGSQTFVTDLRILAWTIAAVLGVEIAVDRRSGRLSVRRRPEATPVPATATPAEAVLAEQ